MHMLSCYSQARLSPFYFVAVLLFVVLLSSCASLPTDYVKTSSTVIQGTDDTMLGQRTRAKVDAHPGQSGFYVLSNGIEALGARLLLAQHAEVSIDLQYYYILPDITGKLLIEQLVKAAERGVRVRILLDDIQTEGYEQLFAVLSANPNIEIRLANPFANRKARGLDIATDFQRLNHRMHNKSITFDNKVTILGGRNIGAEYFGASDDFNYHDVDVLGIGPVSAQVSKEFDTYWNASETVPVTAFLEPDQSPESARQLQHKFETTVAEAKDSPYLGALESTIIDLLLTDVAEQLVWADARVVFDMPYDDSSAGGDAGPEVLAGILVAAVDEAVEELFVISPYFVPGNTGVERFRQLRERGVRCIVLTNSLASTDVAAVYGGYKDYQAALLELGVELWEVMAYPDTPGNQRGKTTERRSLHAKTFAIDRKRLFVGSLNWDPRSRNINTEMGVLIDSTELATDLVESVSAELPGAAWKLRLNDSGEVEWVDVKGGNEIVYSKPPQTGFWRRFNAWITGMNALEGQL